jgi:hypothetical protein
MLRTIRGKFADGRVTLDEEVSGINNAEVLVTFLESEATDTPPASKQSVLKRGMWKDRGLPDLSIEDFQKLRSDLSSRSGDGPTSRD